MTTTATKSTQTMTYEEDKKALNEVIDEITIQKKRGRPKLYTPEEIRERIKAYDRKRYHADPQKKKCICFTTPTVTKSLIII